MLLDIDHKLQRLPLVPLTHMTINIFALNVNSVNDKTSYKKPLLQRPQRRYNNHYYQNQRVAGTFAKHNNNTSAHPRYQPPIPSILLGWSRTALDGGEAGVAAGHVVVLLSVVVVDVVNILNTVATENC